MSNHYRSKEELLIHLSEQINFLKASCESYDNNNSGEAKRLAVIIRLLVYDTAKSTSLLNQLDSKDIPFYDTSLPVNRENIITHQGLTMIQSGADGAIYIPRCHTPKRPDLIQPKKVDFEQWWNGIVLVDKGGIEFSRRDLILNLCNKEGGAHVDPTLDSRFARITKENSMAWKYTSAKKQEPIKPIELASVRQIAHEVLLSLQDMFPELINL